LAGPGLPRPAVPRGRPRRPAPPDDIVAEEGQHWTKKEEAPAAPEQPPADPNELPSVALTTKFLALCQQYGSERLAVRVVAAAGPSSGARVPALLRDARCRLDAWRQPWGRHVPPELGCGWARDVPAEHGARSRRQRSRLRVV